MLMRLTIEREWEAIALARHMAQINLLYVWEYIDRKTDLSYYDRSRIDAQIGDVLSPAPVVSWENSLRLASLMYASPTVEVFRGAVSGLAGLSDLIERLIFFRQTKELKSIELELKRNELIHARLETLEKAKQTLKDAKDVPAHMIVEISDRISRYEAALLAIGKEALEGVISGIETTMEPEDDAVQRKEEEEARQRSEKSALLNALVKGATSRDPNANDPGSPVLRQRDEP